MKTLQSFFSLLLVAAFAISASTVSAQTHQVNTDKSTVKWVGKKVTGQHNGKVKVKSGQLTQEKNGGLSGEFVIDMASITCDDLTDAGYNQKLVGHLKSDDFFSTEKHPTATFKITKAVAQTDKSGNNYLITGDLTIKGITKTVTFPAKVTLTKAGFIAQAKVNVDRTQYDIKYGSSSFFDSLGDKAIDNNFELDLYVVSK
ncbi:MAG: YceI family protein [Chitinophagales bacterium]|nr:YceI family protein [Chitinophagales bacterium]